MSSPGSQGSQDNDNPTVYAVRFFPRARQEAEEAALRLADLAGEEVAAAWLTGFEAEVRKLSSSPRRFPLVPEPENRRLARETRQLVYRRTSSSVAYRILFFIEDDGADGPTVLIIHVRHAARRPLTAQEARELRESL
jgi:plasmid stabilization system protein ParE